MSNGTVVSNPSPSAPGGSLGQFVAKTFIVVAACTIGIIAVLWFVDSVIEARINQIDEIIAMHLKTSKISNHDLWTRFEKTLEKQAGPAGEISAEERRKIVAEVRIIGDRWRPFVKELVAAAAGEEEQAGKK
jgi:hypothetical protein